MTLGVRAGFTCPKDWSIGRSDLFAMGAKEFPLQSSGQLCIFSTKAYHLL